MVRSSPGRRWTRGPTSTGEAALHSPGKAGRERLRGELNGKFRDECLNEHWFTSLDRARDVIEQLRPDYNEVRPHSSLGNISPAEFARRARAELRSPTALFVPPAGEDLRPGLTQGGGHRRGAGHAGSRSGACSTHTQPNTFLTRHPIVVRRDRSCAPATRLSDLLEGGRARHHTASS